MNFNLQEIDHLLTALESMSSDDIAEIRKQNVGDTSDIITAPYMNSGIVDHTLLIEKLKTFRYRLTQC